MSDEELHRVTDWQWLSELLSEFDIIEKRMMRKNAHDFTSLEARLYTEIQKRYKQREKPDYIQTVGAGRTSRQHQDAMRIHGEQVETMDKMGYGLMLDGFTFYKYGYELQPYDFDRNFNMHQAYEIHSFTKSGDHPDTNVGIPNNKPGRDEEKMAREITKYLLDRSFEWYEATDTQTAIILAVARELAPFFTSKLNQATEEAETSTGLLREVMEPFDEDCRYDHHGYCQAHFLHDNPCPFGRAKLYLAQLTANQGNKEGE